MIPLAYDFILMHHVREDMVGHECTKYVASVGYYQIYKLYITSLLDFQAKGSTVHPTNRARPPSIFFQTDATLPEEHVPSASFCVCRPGCARVQSIMRIRRELVDKAQPHPAHALAESRKLLAFFRRVGSKKVDLMSNTIDIAKHKWNLCVVRDT